MASKIELSRGNLLGKKKEGFGSAELFWEAKSSGETSEFKKWNEGTLWIGRPDVDGAKGDKSYAIPIAGGRVHNALVFRGTLDHQRNIDDSIFNHARVGDFYVWSSRAEHQPGVTTNDTFRDIDDFRKGDILLIYSITGEVVADQENNIDPNSGNIVRHADIRYVRINNSGGDAKDTYFVTENGQPFPQFQATHVEAALLELQYEKLQYVSEIGRPSDIPVKPVIGGFYLITSDNLEIPNFQGKENLWPDKGDFIIWTRDTLYIDNDADDDVKAYSEAFYWQLIPSGYTNADELDYYDLDRAKDLEIFVARLDPTTQDSKSTFLKPHVDKFKENSSTVHKALDFLMENKAQLDEFGKVPLSQLHDTVIGAMQFRGTWKPYKLTEAELSDPTKVRELEDGTQHELINPNDYHKLPGFERYDQGIPHPELEEDVTQVQNGDYYIVESSPAVFNLLYKTNKQAKEITWELNSGDWIVFQGAGNIDETSGGTKPITEGYWSVIDNSDRLKSLDFIENRATAGDFWTEEKADKKITLVGTPTITSSHKIGLAFPKPGVIEIVGDHLVNQKSQEDSVTTYYPRYSNIKGEVENSYLQDIKLEALQAPKDIHNPYSKNKTIAHSNMEIGTDNEKRELTTFGNIKLMPHIEVVSGANVKRKSIAEFHVRNSDGNMSVLQVMAPDGTNTTQDEIIEDIIDGKNTKVNILLPERSSTVIGKLAGIELEAGRITKSIIEGYEESSSIEEHINAKGHDASEDGDNLKDKHLHDEIHNVVELHSQLSVPVQNTYEIYFGKYHTTEGRDSYTSKDYDPTGAFAENIVARLTRNQYTSESNIQILLPCASGTLLTQQNIINLYGKDDDSYLPMFGTTKTLDGEKLTFNVLRRSPIRQVRNALRTQIKQTPNEDTSLLAEMMNSQLADVFAPMKGPDEKRENTVKPEEADTVVENNLIAGEFNPDGSLKDGKTIYATRALGVGDLVHAEGFIVPARTNFPNASQYEDPYTLQPTPILDVVVDMPNESGVMLTSNSRIDGGIYNADRKIND